MTHRVVITEPAENDIDQAFAWWSDHRSEEQAKRWYSSIFPAIATLAENPERCPFALEFDLLSTGLRQLTFGVTSKKTHRIVFTVNGQDVVILRVRHLAQDELRPDGVVS